MYLRRLYWTWSWNSF